MFDFKFLLTLFIVVALFLTILSLPISGLQMFVLEVILLGIYSYYLHKKYKIEYYYGMLMLKTQQGLNRIDDIANYRKELWKNIADIGIVMAFGVFTIFLFKHISKKKLFLGGVALFIFMFFIFPLVYPIAMSVISIPFATTSSEVSEISGINLISTLLLIVTLLIGISLLVVISLVLGSFDILSKIYENIFNGAVETVTPGVSLIIPGINLPFVEGILALAILLFVHECSHALLARVAKIKLNSAGVLIFGFIPLGAFVDPDEEELSRSKKEEQGRVIVAGSTSNFMLAFFALIFFFGITMLPLNVYDTGITLINVKEGIELERGDIIYSIDGVDIESYEHFAELRQGAEPNKNVTLLTDKGEMIVPTDENGLIGIYFSPRIKASFGWYTFLKNLFALLFSLNLFVGMINLLPLPLFDGHHLLRIGLGEKNKLILQIVNVIVIGAMLINILPIFL
jgi:Zn-dependent protease